MANKRFIAWTLGPAVFLTGSILHAQNYLPPTQVQNAISYYSGGIGTTESMAIKADASHHSLLLEFVERRGTVNEYSSGQSVEIQNAQGAIVLAVISDGPFLAVDLPKGHFKITASAFGQPQVRNIDLKAQTSEHLIFVWPAMKQ
jgi:hypothetical protein